MSEIMYEIRDKAEYVLAGFIVFVLYVVAGFAITYGYGYLTNIAEDLTQFSFRLCVFSPIIIIIVWISYMEYFTNRSYIWARIFDGGNPVVDGIIFYSLLLGLTAPVILNLWSVIFNWLHLEGLSDFIHRFRFYPIYLAAMILVGLILFIWLTALINFLKYKLKRENDYSCPLP